MTDPGRLPGRFVAEVVELPDARRLRYAGFVWRQWLDGLEWTPAVRPESAKADAIGVDPDAVRAHLHLVAEHRAPGEWIIDQ